MSDLATGIAPGEIKPKTEVRGVVRRIELAGAFIDIGAEKEAMLHISQIEPGDVKNVRDVLSVGQELTLWVRAVDPANERISVTMFKPLGVEWKDLRDGQVFTGQVVRLEKFGAFVDIGAERPGLVHVSEMDDDYVSSPGDRVKVGEEVEVKVIGVNRKKGQIDLSMKAVLEMPAAEAEAEADGESLTAMALALKKARGEVSTDAETPTPKSISRDVRRRAEQEELLRRTLEQQSKQ